MSNHQVQYANYTSLYGLKQAPRAWYDKIDAYFLTNGFKWCKSDPNLFVKNFGDNVLIMFYIWMILLSLEVNLF